jgi:hypothetical protein
MQYISPNETLYHLSCPATFFQTIVFIFSVLLIETKSEMFGLDNIIILILIANLVFLIITNWNFSSEPYRNVLLNIIKIINS